MRHKHPPSKVVVGILRYCEPYSLFALDLITLLIAAFIIQQQMQNLGHTLAFLEMVYKSIAELYLGVSQWFSQTCEINNQIPAQPAQTWMILQHIMQHNIQTCPAVKSSLTQHGSQCAFAHYCKRQ